MTTTDTAVGELTRVVNGVPLPPAGTYEIDKAHSVVSFVVRHVMVSKVRGHFNDFEGTIVVGEDPASSKVNATVRIDSVDTREPTRDAHLRTSDFFEVDKYPEMSFHSTSVAASQNGDWIVDGELTIKAVKRLVTLNFEYNGASKDPWGGTRIGFSATTEIDREDFDITYNALLEAGGVAVGKTVRIEIEVEAVLNASS